MKVRLSALSLLIIITGGAIELYHAKKQADAVDATLQYNEKMLALATHAARIDLRPFNTYQSALYVGMTRADFLAIEAGQENDTQIISQSANSTVYAVNQLQPSAMFHVTIVDGKVSAIDHHPTTSISIPSDTPTSRPTIDGL